MRICGPVVKAVSHRQSRLRQIRYARSSSDSNLWWGRCVGAAVHRLPYLNFQHAIIEPHFHHTCSIQLRCCTHCATSAQAPDSHSQVSVVVGLSPTFGMFSTQLPLHIDGAQLFEIAGTLWAGLLSPIVSQSPSDHACSLALRQKRPFIYE